MSRPGEISLKHVAWCGGVAILVYLLLVAAFVLIGPHQ